MCYTYYKKPTTWSDCTTLLFYVLAPTRFGSSLPSSGCLLDPPELLEIQIAWVVYHITCGYVTCVPDCSSVCCVSQLRLGLETQHTEPQQSGM
jgi:hypothetical protein